LIDKDRVFRIDIKRVAFFITFLLMFVLTEIGRKVYRPYIYSNDIFDFWIADTIGNLTGTIAVVFFNFAVVNPKYKQARMFLIGIIFGLIVYELLQYFSPKSIFDWRDVIATLIAGLISWGVYEFIFKKYPEKISDK
jgi:glycopeptide antibiotics resistance protein